jgi:hypothetical protein
MRKPLLSALICLVFAPGLASGNPIPVGGPISAYADPFGTDVCLYDTGVGILEVFIVHNIVLTYPSEAQASQFAAPKPACLEGTYLDESSPFPTVGNSQTGISIAYPGCQTEGPLLILTIRYTVTGNTPAGCAYEVVPDPADPTGQVTFVDCSSVVQETWGGVAYINGYDPICEPVAAEETTWGRIKSLYR